MATSLIRMHYRGKRYIVTKALDGHWTWVVILNPRLSVRGRAITKFEAIAQAEHLIDRVISLGTRQSTPHGRPRLDRFLLGILRRRCGMLMNLLFARRKECAPSRRSRDKRSREKQPLEVTVRDSRAGHCRAAAD